MGTGVFGGMIVATFIATVFIALFFVWLACKRAKKIAANVEGDSE
jgi:multidrug efflux pump subunit AcrB